MKKNLMLLMIILTLPTLLAQYWGERVTEKSFESSELYFQSYFLNTYGKIGTCFIWISAGIAPKLQLSEIMEYTRLMIIE